MKLYLVFMYNPDTNSHDQLLGVFESKKKLNEEIKKLSKEIDSEISEEDFEIIETNLNQNWLGVVQ